MKFIVYYDEDYSSNWLNKQVSVKIRDFLKNKGFSILDAEELSKMMEESVDTDTCWNSLIVFSQDVVPEAVLKSSPNSLIRSYLDLGGTIIWIGDIPFYYSGCNPSRQTELEERFNSPEQIEKNRARVAVTGRIPEMIKEKDGKFKFAPGREGCYNTLGVIPVILRHPNFKVKITKEGMKFGLRTTWYSERPILIKGSNARKRKAVILAKTQPRYLMSREKTILSEAKERKLPPNFVDFMSKIIGLVPAIITALSALGFLLAGFGTSAALLAVGTSIILLLAYVGYWFFWSRSTYASAWFVNFDKRHPFSGFIRFWDFALWRITDSMLEEFHGLILKRKESTAIS